MIKSISGFLLISSCFISEWSLHGRMGVSTLPYHLTQHWTNGFDLCFIFLSSHNYENIFSDNFRVKFRNNPQYLF